ncbi:MAG: adenine-specific methyltransferase EcoRI family protein [Selenomonadaceae bacterium]|nr:adenine-specific methyltransferase EcoRI family protein [Selenomonadaceae bacterium]
MKTLANKNKNLNSAAKAKKDKFYTQLEDIENELRHYREFFKGKTVLCNCDDPFESNFFKYFAANFNALELKKLITTSYADSPICQLQLNFYGTENQQFDKKKDALMIEVDELKDWNGDGREDLRDVEFAIKHKLYKTTRLTGDKNYCAGDFRSKELLALLPQADVVVTNPPFSVFRDYIKQLMDFDKKFLIIANINSITYKEVFPLIMQNKIWLGYGMGRAISGFIVPDDYELYGTEARVEFDGQRIVSTNQCLWYTNIETEKRFWDIPLYKKYSPEEYPRYDNYDAINVNKTAEIPCDYFGVMGVPITFLDKYNPNQFEILGATESEGTGFSNGLWHNDSKCKQATINGKKVYKRIFIRRRQNEN